MFSHYYYYFSYIKHNTDLQKKKRFWLLLSSWGSFPKWFSA